MRNGKITWLLAGPLCLGLAGCQQKGVEAPSGTQTPTAVVATPIVSREPARRRESGAATADPVEASRRNAARRLAAETEKPASAPSSEAARRSHEVPAGSILRVQFDRAISTATARVGETFEGNLLDDLLAADGAVVAPSGSAVTGKVEHVVDSGKLARRAELRFRLTELTPAGGRAVSVSTSAYERVGESHTQRNAAYIAGGAAVGALLGQLIGKDTGSTLKGAAAGAAAGTGVAAATGDLDFAIEPHRTVAFTLEKPLVLPAAT